MDDMVARIHGREDELMPNSGRKRHPNSGREWTPAEDAAVTSLMLAEATAHLAEEASGPRGRLIPLGIDPGDDDDETTSPVAKLQAMIGALRGSAALVESTRNMGDGLPMGSPTGDWKPNRLGANPPVSLVDLSDKATLAVLRLVGSRRNS